MPGGSQKGPGVEGAYVALFNISEKQRTFSFSPAAYDLEEYPQAKELWSGKSMKVKEEIKVRLPRHGAAIFRLW